MTVSSTGTTDLNGRFSIRFWPNSAGSVVTLWARRTAESGPLPDLRLNYPLAQQGEENPPVALTIGNTGPLERYRGVVTGTEPIGGALLRFRAEIGNGIYQVDVPASDDEGLFEVDLYPGRYEVDVIPPLESRYRINRVIYDVQPGQPIELSPQRQVLVSGTVRGPDGAGVGNARLYVRLEAHSLQIQR